MGKYILETRNLTKVFGKQKVVNDVSLKIKENSIYGLLGPNGAGKSTILKMLTGIFYKSSGEIIFEGHTWSRNNLRDIGSLIEAPPLYENLTAKENLKVRTLLLDLPDSRIDEVLKIGELKNIDKKKTAEFSMGMKQRLGIAMALLNNPKLLILDEPTNGLDPLGIQKLRNLIRGFQKEGMTIIISSHILQEVEQIVDHIGIISDGRLIYQNSLDRTDNLEDLFMDVIKKERG